MSHLYSAVPDQQADMCKIVQRTKVLNSSFDDRHWVRLSRDSIRQRPDLQEPLLLHQQQPSVNTFPYALPYALSPTCPAIAQTEQPLMTDVFRNLRRPL
jgi:hypothetical protein